MKNENQKYCSECGTLINVKAEICPSCGVRQSNYLKNSIEIEENNRWIITLMLCWFLGVFGVHRFYTGHTFIGIAQILTLGGCGIWVLIDFIIIVSGSYKDSNGIPIKNK